MATVFFNRPWRLFPGLHANRRKWLILVVFGGFLSVSEEKKKKMRPVRSGFSSTVLRRGKHPIGKGLLPDEDEGRPSLMNWGLFESFCELLESIPIKGVVRAVDAERKMVEDDLRHKRTEMDENVTSVLGFCDFLTLAMGGNHPSVPGFPSEHRVFYASIVRRLVDAGALPAEFQGQFEETAAEEWQKFVAN